MIFTAFMNINVFCDPDTQDPTPTTDLPTAHAKLSAVASQYEELTRKLEKLEKASAPPPATDEEKAECRALQALMDRVPWTDVVAALETASRPDATSAQIANFAHRLKAHATGSKAYTALARKFAARERARSLAKIETAELRRQISKLRLDQDAAAIEFAACALASIA